MLAVNAIDTFYGTSHILHGLSLQVGDTVVLVTACYAASPREGIDFLPLTVDYREYTYASGRIPGGFFKREGKPSEKEVLTSRVIDRPIRPLFPNGWRHETQIIALVLSADSENDSDVLAITGASAALALSEIPFLKTIAAVRVGLVDGVFVINPTYSQRRQSRLDLVVAGSRDGIVMVEAGAREASEEEVVEAFGAYGENPEWERTFLEQRLIAYRQAGRPEAESAAMDVVAFRQNEALAFETALRSDAPPTAAKEATPPPAATAAN